jgi:parallel beta-helix repeat protein
MEPKSTAFYTAVAIAIFAVLGATIFPTLGQAVQATTTTTRTTDENSDNQGAADENSDNQGAADNGNDNGGSDQGQTTQRSADDPQSQRDENTGSNENNNNDGANDRPALASSDAMVSCGEEISTDVTLQQDLNCPDNGVTITGDNVEFNMNGHTITSNNGNDNSLDLTGDVSGNSGISVTGAQHVTILGLGQISGFDTGIEFVSSSDVQVSDVTLRDNGIGALVSGSPAVYISKNPIDSNGIGVLSKSSNDGVVSFNQLISNEMAGIVLESSDGNVIAGNGVFGNGDNGIYVDKQSNSNTVDYNIVFGQEADLNNADGLSTDITDNAYGENNKCGTSTPAGLC